MVDPYPVGKINFAKFTLNVCIAIFGNVNMSGCCFHMICVKLKILYTTNNNRQTMSGQECYQWKYKDVIFL